MHGFYRQVRFWAPGPCLICYNFGCSTRQHKLTYPDFNRCPWRRVCPDLPFITHSSQIMFLWMLKYLLFWSVIFLCTGWITHIMQVFSTDWKYRIHVNLTCPFEMNSAFQSFPVAEAHDVMGMREKMYGCSWQPKDTMESEMSCAWSKTKLFLL